MDPPTSEKELIRKLVDTCHLNVPERRGLPGGRAKASLILDAIEETLRTGGWFPSGMRPEDDYAGGLIELSPDGHCKIYWKSEFSFLRYELDAVGDFETAREAARTLIRATFGEQIDGIAIDWDA